MERTIISVARRSDGSVVLWNNHYNWITLDPEEARGKSREELKREFLAMDQILNKKQHAQASWGLRFFSFPYPLPPLATLLVIPNLGTILPTCLVRKVQLAYNQCSPCNIKLSPMVPMGSSKATPLLSLGCLGKSNICLFGIPFICLPGASLP